MEQDINELANQLDTDYPTLDESKFRNNFLPFFLRRIDPKLVPTAVSAWVGGVAGSATMPVRVIDSQGNVLFTVPPLINTTAIEIKDGEHFTYIANASSVLRPNQPESADALFTREMESAMQSSLEISHDDEWLPILQYYNLISTSASHKVEKDDNLLGDLGL